MTHLSSTAKHVGDAIAIPGGMVGVLSYYMEALNQLLTFLVLITSLIWGIYRIIEMHEKRKENKHE